MFKKLSIATSLMLLLTAQTVQAQASFEKMGGENADSFCDSAVSDTQNQTTTSDTKTDNGERPDWQRNDHYLNLNVIA